MGTNFYAHLDVCPHCDRPSEVIHIGKRSGGWSFHFHGTDTIRSWEDWQVELKRSLTVILDEYGTRHTFEEFRRVVEDSRDSDGNHYDYCHGRYDDPRYLEKLWKDEEGYAFSEGEFS
jgi:hypothetical protein